MAKRILVVDDEIESVKLIGLMLQRRGYEIIAARSGGQALEKAKTGDPDLVILDVMMPDMDGLEVCRRIRADPETADLPVIMFTAKTMVDDKVAGFQAGADDYLTKPVHPEELASRIEAVLLRSTRKRGEEEPPKKRAKLIAFLGAKGGVGVTTLAVNVAVELAQGPAKGKQVVLAELRSGAATAAIQLGLRLHGGIDRLLEEPSDRIDAHLLEMQLQEYMAGLRVLIGQLEPPGVAAALSPAHAEAIVRGLNPLTDYLLLDLGVGLEEANRRILPNCDAIVVCIEPHRLALMLGQVLLERMTAEASYPQALNLARHRIVVVMINKATSSFTINKSMVEEQLRYVLTGVIPPAPELAFQAGEQGRPIILAQPNSLVSQQIRALAERLAGM